MITITRNVASSSELWARSRMIARTTGRPPIAWTRRIAFTIRTLRKRRNSGNGRLPIRSSQPWCLMKYVLRGCDRYSRSRKSARKMGLRTRSTMSATDLRVVVERSQQDDDVADREDRQRDDEQLVARRQAGLRGRGGWGVLASRPR